jgi:ribosome hibernation promoting factor
MQTIVKGKNLEITEPLREYALEKVCRVEKYFDGILKTEIEMSVERNPKIIENQVVEVTIFSSGPIIRAKESAPDMYQAIDLVSTKLERQARRVKKKIIENQVVEVTIFSSGPVIRAKESAPDMYQAIDLVSTKLERQARRVKKKIIDRHHHAKNPFKEPPLSLEEEEGEPMIVKTKSFPLKPMTPEEAALQMDLVGHDFFVFINAETEETNVVYRRKDGNYGLIEPGG